MLNVGGENVAGSEIERAILAVSGVSEVAVVGVRHGMLDEVPVAFVVPQPGKEQALVAAIESACAVSLAPFKRPHLIRLVEDLPRSTLEKVAKAQLRATFMEELSGVSELS